MENMKGDMSGGAAVVAGIVRDRRPPAAGARDRRRRRRRRTCRAAHAYRPGDILRAANGKTIEITNTDAEGRLVLADALWYAREQGATHVIDLATLTGAMTLALGDLYAGLFANDDDWADADPRRGRGERRPPLALAAASALPPLRRLDVRRHEELVRPAARPAPCSRRSS